MIYNNNIVILFFLIMHTPVTWERDLCQFYTEVNQWRESALQCGLSLPPLPAVRQGSPDQQWLLAKDYWDEITSVWGEYVEGYRVMGEECVCVYV